MQLTATEFAKLINDLRCDPRPGERRENPRVPARSRIEVIRLSTANVAPKREMLTVRDISRTGLGLMVTEPIPEGTRLLILLPKTATENFILLCEAARVDKMPGDTHVVGVRMVRRITSAEYDRFVIGDKQVIASMIAPLTAAA